MLIYGGFGGSDEVVSPDDLAQMVADGRLAYILLSGDRGRPEITQWVQSSCELIPGEAYQSGSSQPSLPARHGPTGAQLYHCPSGQVMQTTPVSS